ncbi:formate--phosphoribosylaminoimidazolecarboxamide ligase family protein [Nanoarchaeota archaeon]
MDIKSVLADYEKGNLHVGMLGGHSALDIAHGAKDHGFKTVVVCQKGRDKTYTKYFRNLFDEVILVDKFADVTSHEVVQKLQDLNTIFVHSRYFWVYCDYDKVVNEFEVPIFGTRDMIRLEERDVEKNQYYLLEKAGIRIPKIFSSPKDIDRLVIVKVSEAERGYERAFFLASTPDDYDEKAKELIAQGMITQEALELAVIEEYVLGAHVNLNFFYSVLNKELELVGTDTRRQTNLDGILRLPATEQLEVLKHMSPKMIETGHFSVTMKESLLEKAFEIGERFVETTKKENPPGIIGSFALQGAVSAEEGKEEFVIFDVSMRIPGSPGTKFTPYAMYRHGTPISYGERIAIELNQALRENRLHELCT